MEGGREPHPVGLEQYTLEDINHTANPNLQLQSVICLEDTPGNLGYDLEDVDRTELNRYQKLPDNCGLGILNLSLTNGQSLQN